MAASEQSAGQLVPLRKEHVRVVKFLVAKWGEAQLAARVVIQMGHERGFELMAFVEKNYPAAQGWVWHFDEKRKGIVLIKQEGKTPNLEDKP